MLSGAAGFTYGVNGMWQYNTPDQPFGLSPNGHAWPNTLWTDAYSLSSSREVGLGKELLERYRWWAFERHPDWITGGGDPGTSGAAIAAGIPGEVRVVYLPATVATGACVVGIEPDARYRAFFYDPRTGTEHALGHTARHCARWAIPLPLDGDDWVLELERDAE